MFHLFSALWQRYFAVEEYKVLVLGPDGAGKTTLLEHIKGAYSDRPGLPMKNILPTVGLNIARVRCHNANLLLWDLGGRPCLRCIWPKYYKNAHGVVLVVDGSVSTDNESVWADGRDVLREVLRHPLLANVPLLIIENKMDVGAATGPGRPSLLRLEDAFTEADAGASTMACDTIVHKTSGYGRWVYRLVRTSAVSGEGVDEGMKWLCGILKLNKRHTDAE